MTTLINCTAPAFKRGDRVRRSAEYFRWCNDSDAAFYRGREGVVVGPAVDGMDGLHKHSARLANWLRVRWDGESGYRMATVVNLELVGRES